MRINGNLLKKMRKDLGISKKEFANRLFVSERHVGRMESGQADINLWQFKSIMESLKLPSEDFWMLFLDTKEYESYRTYKHLKTLLRELKFEEVMDILPEFEASLLSKQSYISQFVAYAKTRADRGMPNKQAVEELHKVLRMSMPKYDEAKVKEYRLTYNEVSIISEIANRLSAMGEMERSINLTKDLISSRGGSRTTEEDRKVLFPALFSNLGIRLGKAGRYKESLEVCNEALDISIKSNNLWLVPDILYTIASGLHKIGEGKDMYKPYLVRAYHTALAHRKTNVAETIKKDAKKSFGIKLP